MAPAPSWLPLAAHADAITPTPAMRATTIGEFFVEHDRVRRGEVTGEPLPEQGDFGQVVRRNAAVLASLSGGGE